MDNEDDKIVIEETPNTKMIKTGKIECYVCQYSFFTRGADKAIICPKCKNIQPFNCPSCGSHIMIRPKRKNRIKKPEG